MCNDDDLKPGYRGTVLFGHPGIGKSVGLYFLMCAAAEARIPFVFHRAPSADAYVCLDEQSWSIPATMISKLVFTTRALVLIDSCADVGLSVDVYAVRSAHVVVASPPVPRRYKEFVKYTGARFYTLDLPRICELRAILRLHTLRTGNAVGDAVSVADRSHISLVSVEDLYDDDSLKADSESKVCSPLELFKLFGPNLLLALSGSGQPEDRLLQTEQNDLLQIGIRAATNLARGEWIDTTDASTGYNRLFFEQPHPESPVTRLPPHNVTIPTPFLRGILCDAIRTLKHEDQLSALHHARRFDAILPGRQSLAPTGRTSGGGKIGDEDHAEPMPSPASTQTIHERARSPQNGSGDFGQPGRRLHDSETTTNVVQIGPYDFNAHSAETTVWNLIASLPHARRVVKPKVAMCKNDHFVLCTFPTADEAAVLVSAWQDRPPELSACRVLYVDPREVDFHA